MLSPARQASQPAIWSRPYLLLSLTALLWAGNAIASRLSVGEVSPMILTMLRWVGVCAILPVIYRRALVAALPALIARPWRMLIMAVVGFTGFNVLMYLAAHHTTALNIGLLQGAMPAFVFFGAWLAYRTQVSALQALGVGVTMLGVAIIATGGSLATLIGLQLNRGDLFMLIACAAYASYTVMVRDRPAVPGIAFFTAMALLACLVSLVFVGIEQAMGLAQWPSLKGWLIILYVTFGPSLAAQVMFLRGVDMIGPGRAGLFVNLTPVFTAILAVAILNEPFGWHHALALVLVLGGIWLAERGKI
jgi:drug/metabolite transporter (DMT)-like permease